MTIVNGPANIEECENDECTGCAWCDPPRRAPEPCDPGCPGWAVFDCQRCTVHDPDCYGQECDCYSADCSTLMIDECIDCWHGVPDAPGEEYYQAHPVCLTQLAAERSAERA
jgi:hypothetical protein